MTRAVIIGTALALALVCAPLTRAAVQQEHKPGTHQHPDAQKLKNPTPGDPKSIENGKILYEKLCAECHGDTGKGDGMMAADLEVKPPDLTDSAWEHGATDGEIFVMIRDGSRKGMTPFGKKMAARAIWDVVNYVRTLGPKPSKSH